MRWNAMMFLGLLLMALGALALIFGDAGQIRETLLAGPIEESRTIPLAPIAAGVALGGGVILLVLGSRGTED